MYGRELFAFHIDVFNFLHRKIYFSPSIYPALPNYVYLFLLFFLPNSSLIFQLSLSNPRKSLPFIPIQIVVYSRCKCHNIPEFTTDITLYSHDRPSQTIGSLLPFSSMFPWYFFFSSLLSALYIEVVQPTWCKYIHSVCKQITVEV